MTNFKILEAFLDIQETTMFSKTMDLDYARIIYNDFDTTAFWNYALIQQIIDTKQISFLEGKFQLLNRKPAIYFENNNLFAPFAVLLQSNGYRLNNEDSWMFYAGKEENLKEFDQVQIVDSTKKLDIWLKTLNDCYKANDPQNPYGELGDYIQLARHAWEKNNARDKFEYFIAFRNSMPVAVATLTYSGDLAYISNVGSIQEVRGQGYGKLITLYCIHKARLNKFSKIFLGTEEGSYPNIFYKRIGFETRFKASCYVKE